MAETITITCNDDGSYTVAETEDDQSAQDQPINETVKSVDEVLGLVQKALSDETEDPKAAWNQEAAAREQPQEQPM